MTQIYEVTVTREGRWWLVRIPELNAVTQARRIPEAEFMARDLIALTLDVPIEEIAVNVMIEHVGSVRVSQRVAEIAATRAEARNLDRQATASAARLAKALADQGVTVRDIGTMLGVTFQRAHQLVKTANA
jgi:hypothetical protein